MAKAQENQSVTRKQRRLWPLFVFLLLGGGSIAYLNNKGFDLSEKVADLQKALTEKPPVKATETPASPPVVPPSFDVAYADDAGKLVAAGHGQAGWTIRLGSQTRTLSEIKADENDEWVMTPEEPLAPGEHTLSLSAIDPEGKRTVAGQRTIALAVAPRRDRPLQAKKDEPSQPPNPAIVKREEAAPLPSVANATPSELNAEKKDALQPDGKKDCSVAIVKRGDTLWQIANSCYGDGAKYRNIFRTNRPTIRNPNLIYPDQRFTLPR